MAGFGVVDHRQVATAENVGAKKFLLLLRGGDVQQPFAAGAEYVNLDKWIFFSEGFLQRLDRIQTPGSVKHELAFGFGFFDDAGLRGRKGRTVADDDRA